MTETDKLRGKIKELELRIAALETLLATSWVITPKLYTASMAIVDPPTPIRRPNRVRPIDQKVK